MTESTKAGFYVSRKKHREAFPAIWQGFLCRCPNCRKGKLFDGFLKVTDTCQTCGEDFSHHRADDAPPYFTIFIVGHIVIPLVIWAETAFKPELWVHTVIWVPIIIAMSLAFLRPIKGSVVALQWANHMHGFDADAAPDFPEPPKAKTPQ